MRSGPLILMLAFAGCLDPYASESPFGTVPTSTAPASTGGPGSTGGIGGGSSTGHVSEDSTAGASGGTTTMVFDVGAVADVSPPVPPGCQGKIDFLFVISNDWTMKEVQEQLIAAFPQFITTIQSKFADFDYHVMVVDADPDWGNDWCNGPPCPNPDCPVPDYPSCEEIAALTTCDDVMGAGTLFNAGWSATNERCTLASGNRYLTSSDPELTETFACMAQVGASGYDYIAEAMVAALHPDMNGPGGCNEGFLRDDALLVITLVTDTGDYSSAGTPEEWMQVVLDAKHGDPHSVVFFAIDLPKWLCEIGTIDRICKFVLQFPYWHAVSTDAPDYGPDFEIATGLVELACSEFIPG